MNMCDIINEFRCHDEKIKDLKNEVYLKINNIPEIEAITSNFQPYADSFDIEFVKEEVTISEFYDIGINKTIFFLSEISKYKVMKDVSYFCKKIFKKEDNYFCYYYDSTFFIVKAKNIKKYFSINGYYARDINYFFKKEIELKTLNAIYSKKYVYYDMLENKYSVKNCDEGEMNVFIQTGNGSFCNYVLPFFETFDGEYTIVKKDGEHYLLNKNNNKKFFICIEEDIIGEDKCIELIYLHKKEFIYYDIVYNSYYFYSDYDFKNEEEFNDYFFNTINLI